MMDVGRAGWAGRQAIVLGLVPAARQKIDP
jgi:hypothetical protein